MAKRPGIPFDRLLGIVDALTFERRRNDDDAIDASLVHQRDNSLDGERLRKLRLAPASQGLSGVFAGHK